ncbi:hypothetical protein AGMMS50239_27810 [Bacteroidia bacterium]|nr:hypothetical protein AGMMS50239_27810 [Bacteroidia bacterium]
MKRACKTCAKNGNKRIFNYFSLLIGIWIFVSYPAKSQILEEDYKIIPVNKNLKDFPEKYDVSSPLNTFLIYNYTIGNGKSEDLIALSSLRIKNKITDNTRRLSEKELNKYIQEVVIYKDSVAAVISSYEDSLYTCWYFSRENGQWLNTGEGWGGESPEDAREVFLKNADTHLAFARKIKLLDSVSTDTTAFVNYLKIHGKQPKDFLMNALKNHKLVFYGEIHFRKTSWDLMRQLIKAPEFHDTTGTVFLELSADAQAAFDTFFSNKKKDANIILDIFRKEELTGWFDRGMYDFILNLWDLNNSLPKEKKIKVVATEFSRPFYATITTKEQYKSFLNAVPDRNECMANTIETYIQSTQDKRSCLFIVGSGHAYKSSTLNRGAYQKNGRSAAFILSEKWGKENIFSIFTHSPVISNKGYTYGKIRKGLYDYVFEKNGNKQVAFNLHNSPFGKELFDASSELCFDMKTGAFEDNYDGYIFLEPVDEETRSVPLYEIFTDKFINEIKKRASTVGEEQIVFGNMELKDLNRTQLLQNMKKDERGKRWKLKKN